MTSTNPNAQYNVAAADSLPVRLAAYQRRKMFARFMTDTAVAPGDLVLDVGVTSDRTYAASNYLEAWYPHKSSVTAVGIDDASFLCVDYPGIRFVKADGLNLPFRDQSFDVVHSSAVIEHVGAYARQRAFVSECCRVARRAVFITTPNRWFPGRVSHRTAAGALAAQEGVPRLDGAHRAPLFRRRGQSQSYDCCRARRCSRRHPWICL